MTNKSMTVFPVRTEQLNSEGKRSQRIDKLDMPIDKVNSNVWKGLATTEENQLAFDFIDIDDVERNDGMGVAFEMGNKKQGVSVPLYFSIAWSELENENAKIPKLTAYDKLVYQAVSSLYNYVSETITISQIYHAMGNNSRPNSRDADKIYNSLTKMSTARIYINNTKEHERYDNMPEFVYDDYLLPFRREKMKINGATTDFVIQLYCEPPLMNFARGRKQITTIPRNVLLSPISQTETNLQIQDYLLEQIPHMKSGHRNNKKIRYDTLYAETGRRDSKQKNRARNSMLTYLNHFVSVGYIDGYDVLDDGVEIQVEVKKKTAAKKIEKK